jgi:anion-transporting  ArsA/GET3 family ATPase
LEGRAMRTFVRPTGAGMRVLGRGASPLFGVLRRITGIDLLGDLSSFFALLGGMTEDFSARAAQVERLLKSERTAFLLVTTAQSEPIDEAIWFRRTLRQGGLPFAGVIVNRVHHELPLHADPGQLAELIAAELEPALVSRVLENFHDYHVLARRDARNIERLREELDGQPLIQVPQLDSDVHDVAGLVAVMSYLFASASEREALLSEVVS